MSATVGPVAGKIVRQFYEDGAYWGDAWVEDEQFVVNGHVSGYGAFEDAAQVTIASGDVYLSLNEQTPLTEFFQTWLSRRTAQPTLFSTTLDYLRIESLLGLIDEPARTICLKILADSRRLFESTQGSTHNHQVWPGGYIDHVTDGLNYARHLYAMTAALGRPLPFSLSDALLVFYLHDLEKPWRILVLPDGQAMNRAELSTKADFKAFREAKLAEYGRVLTPAQLNGLTYVEGELQDYSSTRRVMNELAAFCHMVDVWSARIGFAHPKVNDEWAGAGRFRTVSNND